MNMVKISRWLIVCVLASINYILTYGRFYEIFFEFTDHLGISRFLAVPFLMVAIFGIIAVIEVGATSIVYSLITDHGEEATPLGIHTVGNMTLLYLVRLMIAGWAILALIPVVVFFWSIERHVFLGYMAIFGLTAVLPLTLYVQSSWALSPFCIVHDNVGPIAALNRSRHLMSGNRIRLLLVYALIIVGLNAPMSLLLYWLFRLPLTNIWYILGALTAPLMLILHAYYYATLREQHENIKR